jgi:hypothetical protein
MRHDDGLVGRGCVEKKEEAKRNIFQNEEAETTEKFPARDVLEVEDAMVSMWEKPRGNVEAAELAAKVQLITNRQN